MNDIWTPHLTVAGVIEKDGRYLLIEEHSEGAVVLNQPAGHVEENETLTKAVTREVFEESGRRFTPEAICGLYRWRNPLSGVTYIRIAYSGQCDEREPGSTLDDGIIKTLWLSPDELARQSDRLRSPLVLRAVDDHYGGKRYPLTLIDEVT